MAHKNMHLCFFLFALIGCITLVTVSSTTVHNVGDAQGWCLPKNQSFYADWAKNRTFLVGDVLLFRYKSALNTVVQINKQDYDMCTSRNTLRMYFSGNTSVTLDKPGDYFFFCSVGKRCEAGQKLWITVGQGQSPSQEQTKLEASININ